MAQNNIHTIQLARMSSEELTQALLGIAGVSPLGRRKPARLSILAVYL